MSNRLKDIYKELFQEENYKQAYEDLKSIKSGKPVKNNTTIVEWEGSDLISKNWINRTIQKMKDCSFQFKPLKKLEIPLANGKVKTIGIISPRDKIIIKVILNKIVGYFETIFSKYSFGYRLNKNCHCALIEVRKWRRTTWIIEGDIRSYFDNINHHKLAEILKKYIDDSNFIDLYWKLVKAGYVTTNTKYTP